MTHRLTRRDFVQSGVALAAGATALSSSRTAGANERLRLGFIGVGNRGGQLIEAALQIPEVEFAVLCDVYKPYLEKWSNKLTQKPEVCSDYRKVLERKDIDAVVVATPEHWHAIQTIDACKAGKDVYVEKPMAFTVREGRRMVEVARETNRVVQVGLQRRSSKMYAELGEKIRSGGVGMVSVSRAYRIENMYPDGMGKAPDCDPPADLDWDMWLGPRPHRPFNPNIAPYKFRWWKEFSSQMTNWGVHYFDLLRWLNGDVGPVSVSAHGTKVAVMDDRTIPDTMQAVFEFPSGRFVLFGQFEASGNPAFAKGEVEVRGTNGTIYAGSGGYTITPESGGQFQKSGNRMDAVDVKGADGDITVKHIQNFLDCIKSRKRPAADVEEGHLSTLIAHLGNIALETRSRIEWDSAKEQIVNNDAAARLLHYDYRSPWQLG